MPVIESKIVPVIFIIKSNCLSLLHSLIVFYCCLVQVEVKRAEKRDSKPSGMAGGMPGMSAYQQHPVGHPGYGAGAYPQQGATV